MNKSSEIFQSTPSTPSSPGRYSDIREKLNSEYYLRTRKDRVPQGTTDVNFEEERIVSGSIYEHKEEPKEYFQQWEGRVISIENESEFIARIEPLSNDDNIRIVRFNKSKLQIVNSQYFEEGAVFYWTVGLLRLENSKTMMKRSEIRFRLLPPPSEKFIREAEDRARKIFDGISWLE